MFLDEMVQMRGHNMLLCRINTNYSLLSPDTPSYLELLCYNINDLAQ